MWLVVNELPSHLRLVSQSLSTLRFAFFFITDTIFRYSRKHILLGGLWFSKHKPTMATYLMPLIEKFNALLETG